MAGERQHYMPATVIAGFGRRIPGRPRRDSEILVKDLVTGVIAMSTAAKQAHRRALYRLTSPPSGFDPDWVDTQWTRVENSLPSLIERLVNQALAPGDADLLFSYAAMMGVRHPSFKEVAEDHLQKSGHPTPPTADQVNVMRIEGILNVIGDMPDWRWRVLHTTEGDPPFMLSDRCWIYIQEIRGSRSIWVPMAPTAGILGYLEDDQFGPRRSPFEEHRNVVPSWVTWLNAAAGDDKRFTHSMFTHPDNRNGLERLPPLEDLTVNAKGPFRGVGLNAETLYD